jgi:hypothetical protein
LRLGLGSRQRGLENKGDNEPMTDEAEAADASKAMGIVSNRNLMKT